MTDNLPLLRHTPRTEIEKLENEDQKIEDSDLIELIQSEIDEAYDYHHSLNTMYIPEKTCKILFRKYNKLIQNEIDTVFKGLTLSKEYHKKLHQVLVDALSKSISDIASSGVVIAGFGEKELLPTVKAFVVEGIVKSKDKDNPSEILKYAENEGKSNDPDKYEASVIPYAQEEMVCRFMEGVDPDYLEAEEEFLGEMYIDYAKKVVSQLNRYSDTERRIILNKLKRYGSRITKEFSKSMQKFRQLRFTDPTIDAIARLSKNELAVMAEALVYVTSLKRKVSSESETVSEPIDVAVISKGDGFIWIKRKHYFEPKLNPMYFINRSKDKEVRNEKIEST